MSDVLSASVIAGLVAAACVIFLLRRKRATGSLISVLLPGAGTFAIVTVIAMAVTIRSGLEVSPLPDIPVLRTNTSEPRGPIWRSTVRNPEDGKSLQEVNTNQTFDLRIRFAFRPADCHEGVETLTGTRLGKIIDAGVTVGMVVVADPQFIEVTEPVSAKKLLISREMTDDPCDASLADTKPVVAPAAVTFRMKSLNRTGNGRLVVVVYQGGRPIDEIPLQVCIACRGTRPITEATDLSAASHDMLNAADDAPSTDASLYFFDFASGASAGILALRSDDSSGFGYSAWANADQAVHSIRHSLENIAPGLSAATTDGQLAMRSRELTNVLFPPGSADTARGALENFLLDAHKQKKAAPSLFVRVASLDDREPIVVPIGLVALKSVTDGTGFLGRYASIVMPLKLQNYSESDDCTEQVMGVMPKRNGGNGALSIARDAMGNVANRWERAAGEFEWSSTEKFGEWLSTQPRVEKSTALFFLTHHFNDSVWINDNEPVGSNAVRDVKFLRPSWAVLNGCGTDQSRVSGDGFANLLNAAGMQAVIATHSEVPASLAGSYFACMDRALAKAAPNGTQRLGSVHFAATECLWNTPVVAGNTSATWRANALKYSLMGNPNLKVCAIK